MLPPEGGRPPQRSSGRTWSRRAVIFIATVLALCMIDAWILLSGSYKRQAIRNGSDRSTGAAEHNDAVPWKLDMHVVIAANQRRPAGLLAVINSTLRYNSHHRIVFHIIAPPGVHKKLSSFQRVFPSANFSMVSLMRLGISRRIRTRLQAIRTRFEGTPQWLIPEASLNEVEGRVELVEGEPDIYPWAVAYVPALVPEVRRFVWLHTDTLVQADLMPLYRTRLGGRPVAAVEDCVRPIESHVNTSRLWQFTTPSAAPSGCSVDMGVLVIDTLAWTVADITARIEYWASIASRTPPSIGAVYTRPSEPRAAFQLALRGAYVRLPPHWNVFGLGRPSYSSTGELQSWVSLWTRLGVHDDPFRGALAPVRALGMYKSGQGRILHFSGDHKPWAMNSAGPGSVCPMTVGQLRDCTSEWRSEMGESLRMFDAARKLHRERETKSVPTNSSSPLHAAPLPPPKKGSSSKRSQGAEHATKKKTPTRSR